MNVKELVIKAYVYGFLKSIQPMMAPVDYNLKIFLNNTFLGLWFGQENGNVHEISRIENEQYRNWRLFAQFGQ